MTATDGIVRIAMWSGPRNISTAMMRAFENRLDTVVWDEPFYAAELATTGRDHPMRAEVIAAGKADPEKVIARLLSRIDDPDKPNARVFYQKHMTHHMLPAFRRDWIDEVTNAFLIRDPRQVLASYTRKWSEVSLGDIGFPQQLAIFERVADKLGTLPPVVDSNDVLADPRGTLRALCQACGIEFSDKMLSWPAGSRKSDGVWAPAWYDRVMKSTGFVAPADRIPALPVELQRIADAAQPIYDKLATHRINPRPVQRPSA
jgi:hypothetical protein